MNSEWNASCRTSRAGTAASLPRDIRWRATTTSATTPATQLSYSSRRSLLFDSADRRSGNRRTRLRVRNNFRKKLLSIYLENDRANCNRWRAVFSLFSFHRSTHVSNFYVRLCIHDRDNVSTITTGIPKASMKTKEKNAFLQLNNKTKNYEPQVPCSFTFIRTITTDKYLPQKW